MICLMYKENALEGQKRLKKLANFLRPTQFQRSNLLVNIMNYYRKLG